MSTNQFMLTILATFLGMLLHTIVVALFVYMIFFSSSKKSKPQNSQIQEFKDPNIKEVSLDDLEDS